MSDDRWVVVGGSGFLGTAVCRRLVADGRSVTVVDRHPPNLELAESVVWCETDLQVDDIELPDGRVVVTAGSGEPRPAWTWRLPLDIDVPAARLVPHLRGRRVTLASSIEAMGPAPGPLGPTTEHRLPLSNGVADELVSELVSIAESGACPPYRVAGWCRRVAELDPSGRWVYGISKRLEERLHERSGAASLTVLYFANLFGLGQDRVIASMARRAVAGRTIEVRRGVRRSFVAVDDAAAALVGTDVAGRYVVGGPSLALDALAADIQQALGTDVGTAWLPPEADDSCGDVDPSAYERVGPALRPLAETLPPVVRAVVAEERPLFRPTLEVVVPPRPARPDVVAARHAEALWSGRLKAGQRWSSELTNRLRTVLGLPADEEPEGPIVLPTTSGTAALRLAVANVVGPAEPGDVAIVPSFTFVATAEVPVQLGFRIRFVDVDPYTWTVDPDDLAACLAPGDVRFVLAVDTFGVPIDYGPVSAVCAAHRVPLLADSAAAIGSTHRGEPVGRQASAHAFSMSFAKSLTSGGAGGAVVLPTDGRAAPGSGWDKPDRMAELHAIAALDQLEVLPELIQRRRSLAERYRLLIAELPSLRAQAPTTGSEEVLVHFVVDVGDVCRRDLAELLAADGIGTKPYFSALHRHGSFPGAARPLPVSTRLDERALALPFTTEMTTRDVDLVMVSVERALGRLGRA